MSRQRSQWPWLAPTLLVLVALSIYPLIFAVEVSLRTPSGYGLGNFTRLATDRLFLISLWQTIAYTASALAVEFALGLALALLVNREFRGRGLLRSILLIPMLLPPVVVAVIWRLILNPEFGVLNGTLRSLGLNTAKLTWAAAENTAMPSVILVDVWEWTPFMFLLLLAGLQALPVEPFEAAVVDGASRWQIFRRLTLPMLRPVIAIAVLLRGMDLLRVFDQIFILTQGGPGFATETVTLYIYRTAFRFYNFGYATAMAFVLLVATTVIARAFLRLLQQQPASA
ncbi:MAG TPA: sugar ABC transporter permease [Bryobacterales bacterium]|nr:sugar ABC transporter permease [Bryobacterales bacterium]